MRGGRCDWCLAAAQSLASSVAPESPSRPHCLEAARWCRPSLQFQHMHHGSTRGLRDRAVAPELCSCPHP
eukprot:scaffold145648_cov37-Tisochrysis_lutea.AAC.4